jgi:hypothetical protein
MSDFKFEGFEPANTIPVPDVLFDKLLPHLNEAQLKVMLYIIRRTLGFKKTSDAISLKQFRWGITTKKGEKLDEGCGLKNFTTIVKAIAALEEMGCIESEKGETDNGDSATTVYRIRFRGTAPNVVPTTRTVVPTTPSGVQVLRETEDGVLRETEPQQTVIQQTVIQERTKKKPSPSPSFPVATTAIGELDNLEKTIADYTEFDLRKLPEFQLYALLTSKQKEILQRWRGLFKNAPVKLDGKLARALYDLESYDPSAETLEAIRRYCFSIDRPTDKFPKGYYKTRGVKLWDIVEHYADWQQTQEAPLQEKPKQAKPYVRDAVAEHDKMVADVQARIAAQARGRQ